MEILSERFLDSCRKDEGITLRGEGMTRIETFVDAAFAFAFTLLVISIDSIPSSTPELLHLSLDIPAFIASASTIGIIWYAHSRWSRAFGLQDPVTAMLSIVLVIFVLIFVYPIKLMFRITFAYFSDGYFNYGLDSFEQLDISILIIYFSLGFLFLSIIYILLYINTLKFAGQLRLNDYEKVYCQRVVSRWLVVCATAAISCLMAAYMLDHLPWAIYIYATIPMSLSLVEYLYRSRGQASRVRETRNQEA
tara:strand:- start:2309 stop:3058 length:750 start_codon:yes stop_codon:yes gene_type:complete